MRVESASLRLALVAGPFAFCIESARCFSERARFPFLSQFDYARRNGLQRPTGSVASDLLAKWRALSTSYRARMSVWGVRRDKAALSSGCKSHPANAPAGSNRSSYGGDEIAEAFG